MRMSWPDLPSAGIVGPFTAVENLSSDLKPLKYGS